MVRGRHATRIVLITIAATLWAAHADAGLCVDVDLHAASRAMTPVMVETLEREATAIWAPYGVDLRWERGACIVEDASFDIVIEHPLPCPSGCPTLSLGATRLQQSRINQAPIWIDFSAIDKTLASLTMGQLLSMLGHQGLSAEDMGRAFGRVLAHEIGHVLLGMPNHRPDGLMRSTFEAAELVRRVRWQYRLSEGDVVRLEQRSRIVSAAADDD
jgi:hypothetical protein